MLNQNSRNYRLVPTSQEAAHAFPLADKSLAILALVPLLPIWAFNAVISIYSRNPLLCQYHQQDILGRSITLHRFSNGIYRDSACILAILRGHLSLCGAPLGKKSSGVPVAKGSSGDKVANSIPLHCPAPGLFSLHQLQSNIGLSGEDLATQLNRQAQMGIVAYLGLILRCAFNRFFYRANKQLRKPAQFNLFGIAINNHSMCEALDWVVSKTEVSAAKASSPEVAFFINAHSINLSYRTRDFRGLLQQADKRFADGSGVRLAAKIKGIQLRDNVNGTDMLPLLCQRAVKQGLKLYFLGAKPGIAQQAADNLERRFPGLQIVGTQHGYFNQKQGSQITQDIHASGADVVLVGLGSPNQEAWCLAQKDKLQCNRILAVGGLFDYYAGAIKRAPLWMREMGLEWVWRLLQEPYTKFKRYVIGTPEFLIRTFIFKQYA